MLEKAVHPCGFYPVFKPNLIFIFRLSLFNTWCIPVYSVLSYYAHDLVNASISVFRFYPDNISSVSLCAIFKSIIKAPNLVVIPYRWPPIKVNNDVHM